MTPSLTIEHDVRVSGVKLSIVSFPQRNRTEIFYPPDEQTRVIGAGIRKIIIRLSGPRPSTLDYVEGDEGEDDVVGYQHQHISFKYHVCYSETETGKLELDAELCQIRKYKQSKLDLDKN